MCRQIPACIAAPWLPPCSCAHVWNVPLSACSACLSFLITCPAAGWHSFCDEFPSRGRRRRKGDVLHNLRLCGEGLPNLSLFHKLHSLETPVPQGHRELIVEGCITKRWSKSMISFSLASKFASMEGFGVRCHWLARL